MTLERAPSSDPHPRSGCIDDTACRPLSDAGSRLDLLESQTQTSQLDYIDFALRSSFNQSIQAIFRLRGLAGRRIGRDHIPRNIAPVSRTYNRSSLQMSYFSVLVSLRCCS